MRRHGWQLPYHPLQVVAIAVFFALVFAFYVFFAPFVGSKLLEIAVIVLYSPTVVVVFVLYVWCVAVDPADNGLIHLKKCNSPMCSRSRAASSIVSSRADGKDLEMATGPKVDKCSTLEVAPTEQSNSCWVHTLCALICSLFCKPKAKLPPNEADMLYCSLCKVEISMDSKHCRVCDKCIDGFDHHCRWLNNCVGRKNYKDFVALMVSAIAMLILQWSVGLWVLVHCFLRFKYFQGVITSKLGSSFSFAAYISVVAVCTILAMAVTYPLTQLFFFHVLLIRKGISTYDYIVAMREQDQKGIADTIQSSTTSPTSSVGTTPSAAISAGALQGRAWCTPPRLFLDHEQGIYPPVRSLSVKDATSGLPSSKIEFERKKPVKLNPWALASLNKDDVLRAATAAKKQSSILRSVKAKNEKSIVHDSSGSMSSPGDVSTDFASRLAMTDSSQRGAEMNRNLAGQLPPASFMDRGMFSANNFDGSGSESGDIIQLARRARKMLNPLQMEAMNAFKSSHAFSATTLSSSPDSSRASSDPHISPPNQSQVFGIPRPSDLPTDWRYKTQGSETAEESDGDVSSPCTPIRQVVLGARKGGLRS